MTPVKRRHSEARNVGGKLFSGRTLVLLFTLAMALGGADSVRAEAPDIETAALAPGALRPGSEATLPQLLTDADAERYRRTLKLQARARWVEADGELAGLASKILLGHVLAERYLAPDGYHAKFAELASWLQSYADLPMAPEIYRLAVARMPKGAKEPRQPDPTGYSPGSVAGKEMSETADGSQALSALERKRLNELRRAIRHAIEEGTYPAAEKLLASRDAERLLAPDEYDQLQAEIVSGYYFLNRDEDALALVDAAPQHVKRVNPAAEWAGGLAAWRLRNYSGAAHHFERLATADQVDSWTRAAGAYWAARSHLRAQEPERVGHWLEVSANYPYTFYGVLARRLSGRPFTYNWELPALTREDVAAIQRTPQGTRALALLQIGQDALAEQELRRISPAQPEMAHAILAVSERADMPSLAMQLAEKVADASGRRYDAALYPVPSWQPEGGFTVDRALVLALIRQESKFLTGAKSTAGARGLMQLMPGTARFAADGTPYAGGHRELLNPAINITLGQNYLAHLMDTDSIRANLFLLVAAYNGGPSNVARWQRSINHDNDPLLFIENIPSRETRQFVVHVLTNYWIYCDQLGQTTPALDAIVEGKWPTYN
ncbi:MAG TPA: lytic transglycosylase domain-containing protein [Alphaproteobacteria bacterium]|nr:lytic transglycosylase domain-containing protein [Alphaproteobacteria bacterium]